MNPVTTPINEGLVIFELTEEDRKRLRNIKLMSGGAFGLDLTFHRMCIQQAVELLTESPESWEVGKIVRERDKVQEELGRLPRPFYPMDETPEYREKRQELRQRLHEVSEQLAGLQLEAAPICVSDSINAAMISLNDRNYLTARQRGRLKGLVEEIMNTCPVKRTVRHYKTKPDRVEEKPWQTATGYRQAEAERRKILKDIEGVSFNEAINLIRQAAGIYKVTRDGLPGGANNPIAEVH